MLAFFVAAALEPLTRLLDRWHVPCPLAAVLAPFAAMAVIGGTFALVVPAFIAQAPSLVNSVQQAISLVDQLLAGLPGPKVDVAALASRLAEQLFGGGAAAGTSGAYSWSRSSTQSASG